MQPTSDTLRGTGQLIGTALNAQFFDDGTYLAVAAREFNYITHENSLKWDATEPSQGQFNFDRADQIIDFAEANGMQVKGHTLVWHNQLPGWVQNLNGAQAVRSAMTNHIQTLMQRYRGRVVAWDVVNEAVEDGNTLRSSVFFDTLGETFIDEAFQIARAADPDAVLLYNDFGIEGLNGKSNRAFELISRLVSDGVPIDGVGLQMHISTNDNPSAEDIRANIQRYAQLGLRVNISELDVSVCSVNGSQQAKFDAQRDRYLDVVRVCVAEDNCDAVTLWGVTDRYSWLNGAFPCEAGETGNPWPLVFDDSYQPKPAFQGLLEALSGL